VELSDGATDGSVAVRFELRSDPGLEYGGWTLDQLCIVGFVPTVCGDGTITGSELCDDGPANSDTMADACRTDCRPAHCGDGTTDTGESCDDGNSIAGDGCEPDCSVGPVEPPDAGPPAETAGPIVVEQCGCRLTGRSAAVRPLALSWLSGIALLAVRRRRYPRRSARPHQTPTPR
jgi:cysteine-rich repeat protein